jgi:stress-induced morphogen
LHFVTPFQGLKAVDRRTVNSALVERMQATIGGLRLLITREF